VRERPPREVPIDSCRDELRHVFAQHRRIQHAAAMLRRM
jgi:hypothetical protein